MYNIPQQDEDYTYSYEKREHERAKRVLEVMKGMERERQNDMHTILLPSGAMVSHTNKEILSEYKKLGKKIKILYG